MVNLLRWRLEHELGYAITARIPMHMPNGVPIYDMVFATDHWVGDAIMTDLYRAAAEREPQMLSEARENLARKRDDEAGILRLFDVPVPLAPVSAIAWQASTCWRNPTSLDWWTASPALLPADPLPESTPRT